MPAALLFAADPGGALRLVVGTGTWGGDAIALRGLAETLGGGVDVLDVTGAIEGARFAAGVRLGDGEGALLVLAPEARQPDDAWNEDFAASAQVALGLVRATPIGPDPGRLLHEIAIHPGSFETRLGLALERSAQALGLDAAVLAWTEDGVWTPYALFDPSGALVPTGPVPLGETLCAVTCQTDGPFAIDDAAQASPVPVPFGSYLGVPVFAGGGCVGTFSVMGHDPRPRPFSERDRALVESLARWAGTVLQSTDTARRLADREADLAALFDAAPMGMGVARLLDGDIEFVRVNAAAAASLGSSPQEVAGQKGTEVGLGGRFGRRWLHACQSALADGPAHRFEVDVDDDTALRTTVARIESDDDAIRFAFIVEEATDRDPVGDKARAALLKHLDREIRSPLTSILGYADLLDADTSPAELDEVRSVIARSGERLLSVLDDLMLLDDDLVAHPVPVDACAIVTEVAEASRQPALARRVVLNLWCTLPEGPILLDRALFERLVRVLVGGAVASAEQAVDIRLRSDGPGAFELAVLGGAPADEGLLAAGYVPRLTRALGGTAQERSGERPGWTIRLPRRPVPVVDLGGDGAAAHAAVGGSEW